MSNVPVSPQKPPPLHRAFMRAGLTGIGGLRKHADFWSGEFWLRLNRRGTGFGADRTSESRSSILGHGPGSGCLDGEGPADASSYRVRSIRREQDEVCQR